VENILPNVGVSVGPYTSYTSKIQQIYLTNAKETLKFIKEFFAKYYSRGVLLCREREARVKRLQRLEYFL